MTQTIIQKSFAPFKTYLPKWLYNPIRSTLTACVGPFLSAYRSGYLLSCFKMAAVSKSGNPVPWYTYPCIDFLRFREFESKFVLEFGGGQSTLWWAERAKSVVTLEGDLDWYNKIKSRMPGNVDLYHVSMENDVINYSSARHILESLKRAKYDVIIIDGLYRSKMIPIALNLVSDDGMIICDNAEGFGFYEGFRGSGLNRVDFFGNAPGVVLPHCTSVFFKGSSFAFNYRFPIPVVATD